MTEALKERLIVRTPEKMLQLESNDWNLTTLVACLSVDPRTFDEWSRAWLRYRPNEPMGDLPWEDFDGPPGERPWTLVDLVCQRLLAGNGASVLKNGCAYQRDEGKWTRDMPTVWVNLRSHWMMAEDCEWEDALAPLPVPVEPIDVRGVLYGRPMAAGIARLVLKLAQQETLPATRVTWEDIRERPNPEQREIAQRWHALTVRAHAEWLMTPHKDLADQSPRTFLHKEREWVEAEIDHRSQQWTNEQAQPRGLDVDTFAYRHGPMGRHEVVMYFDFCRVVLDFAWDQVTKEPTIDVVELTNRLHEHSKWWLEKGRIDDDPTPPATIIEKERRLIPLTSDGSHLDCDCPICRMEADGVFGSGPTFETFDGHHLELDEEFAFSLSDTYEDWKFETGRIFGDPETEPTPAPPEKSSSSADLEPTSVWQSSFVSPDAPSSILSLALRLAELIDDLKQCGDQAEVDALNAAFDDFRRNMGEPIAKDNFVEILEQLAADHPPLTPKVADLQSKLDEHQRQQAS